MSKTMRLVLAALVPLGLVVPARSDAFPPDFPPESRDTAALLVRLSELPPGYLVDDPGCGLDLENAPPRLAQIIRTHLPDRCVIDFFQRRGIPTISDVALVFKTQEGASAMFSDRLELLRYETGIEQLKEKPQTGIGEEARMYVSPDALTQGRVGDRKPGSVIVWRRGGELGLVAVAATSARRSKRIAHRLALIQDARMRKPTPLPLGEDDDSEVWLDDPRLDVPVYWLGRSFASRSRLPTLRLFQSFGPPEPGSGEYLGKRASLEYDMSGSPAAAVVLDLWRPAAWRRFKRTRLGRQVWGSRCARAKHLHVRSGRAVVYSGYARRPRSKRCPARPFDEFVAHVYFDRVVVAINMPNCLDCAGGKTGPSAPYNSVKGMTAVARGLRLRRP
jgi:hypothetical protein